MPILSAQRHYRDALGFEIGWHDPNGIGAVSRGNVAIFFRKTSPPFEAAIHWVIAEDIDAKYNKLRSTNTNIVEPLERKRWGLRQFIFEGVDSRESCAEQWLAMQFPPALQELYVP